MKTIVKHPITHEIIEQARSYHEFNQWVEELYAQEQTTNGDNSPAKLEYTKLNIQRTNRLNKRAEVVPEVGELVKKIDRSQVWLVITEGWCGDSAQVLPYIHKIAELNPLVQVKVIPRDEYPEIMDAFLTNGSRSIPKIIFLDADSLEVYGEWGPRPAAIQEIHIAEKKNPEIGVEQANLNLHRWYTKDKGTHIQEEVAEILRGITKGRA